MKSCSRRLANTFRSNSNLPIDTRQISPQFSIQQQRAVVLNVEETVSRRQNVATLPNLDIAFHVNLQRSIRRLRQLPRAKIVGRCGPDNHAVGCEINQSEWNLLPADISGEAVDDNFHTTANFSNLFRRNRVVRTSRLQIKRRGSSRPDLNTPTALRQRRLPGGEQLVPVCNRNTNLFRFYNCSSWNRTASISDGLLEEFFMSSRLGIGSVELFLHTILCHKRDHRGGFTSSTTRSRNTHLTAIHNHFFAIGSSTTPHRKPLTGNRNRPVADLRISANHANLFAIVFPRLSVLPVHNDGRTIRFRHNPRHRRLRKDIAFVNRHQRKQRDSQTPKPAQEKQSDVLVQPGHLRIERKEGEGEGCCLRRNVAEGENLREVKPCLETANSGAGV